MGTSEQLLNRVNEAVDALEAAVETVTGGAAQLGNAVHRTGDETISGTKTFSASPSLPTPAAGDNSTKGASTAFVQAAVAQIREIAQTAQETADTALPKTGGTMTGPLNLVAPAADDCSAKAASTGWVAAYAPQKLADSLYIHVGGNNVSDTYGINAGRGLDANKLFATLDAAISYATKKYYYGTVYIVCHADLEIAQRYQSTTSSLNIHIISDSTKRKISLTQDTVISNGFFRFANVILDCGSYKLEANGQTNRPTLVIGKDCSITGTNLGFSTYGPNALLVFERDVEINGTTGAWLVNAIQGATVLLTAAISGNVTGKRYNIASGGRIIASGDTAKTWLPGTISGTETALAPYIAN